MLHRGFARGNSPRMLDSIVLENSPLIIWHGYHRRNLSGIVNSLPMIASTTRVIYFWKDRSQERV